MQAAPNITILTPTTSISLPAPADPRPPLRWLPLLRVMEQEGWHVQLYFCDVGSVGYMLGKGFNYLDRKFILQVHPPTLTHTLWRHEPTYMHLPSGHSHTSGRAVVGDVDMRRARCI